jgi:sugar phosphate isomerase/epimerase
MIRFSCADFTFPLLSRLDALHLVRLLGFDHVDIGLFARSSHFSPRALQQAPRSYKFQVAEDLKAANLSVSDVFLQIGEDPAECPANDPDPYQRQKNRDVFMRAVEFCAELGCEHITGLPGVFHAESSAERDMELAIEEAAWRVDVCSRADLQYAIEAHIGSLCPDVASTIEFLHKVPGLTLTLDYGHFVWAGETSQQVHSLLPFASHLHVRGGAKNRLQTPLKENEIDFAGMTEQLTKAGYDGFLALEYVWIDWNGCNTTDNVSETLLLRRLIEARISLQATQSA